MKQIYKIRNLVNNKIYIGLTTQGAWDRYLNHLSEARCGSKWPIHNALRKYGKENFELVILHTLKPEEDPKELFEIEKYYIALFKSNDRNIGYNLTSGGEGSLGIKRTQEWLEKGQSTRRAKLENGLYTRWGVKVKVTNILDNTIQIFQTKTSCVKHFNITQDILNRHIKQNKTFDNKYQLEKI